VETIGSKRSYALTWCMPNNDDDDDAIYQTVGTVVHNKRLSRHEFVIINRLRIGHTRLTHSYLFYYIDVG